jgi:M6 family metalloprotease-like protein
MPRQTELFPRYLGLQVHEHLLDRVRLDRYLDLFPYAPPGPRIIEFAPLAGYAGTMMVIVGSGFSADRFANHVEVGGAAALVVNTSPTKLLVITHNTLTMSGPVKVTVGSDTATGPVDFKELPWPAPGSGEDGPPLSFAGAGAGGSPSAGTVPPTGTARILVVTCNPTDLVPPDPVAARQDVVDVFDQVSLFYEQASYGQLTVEVDVTDHVELLQNAAYYHRANGDPGYPNIDNAVLPQLMAECAQGAVDQGFNLDNYSVMVASVFMLGLTVRAWGGWAQSNFAYDDGGSVNINITTAQPLGMIAQRHDADWGRVAHEFGHNLVDGGLVLGEDVYSADLVDPAAASAQNFEMMGNHDSHPLFSGFFLHQLGWYDSANIVDLDWDRNPFSQEYDLIAHGLTQDASAGRYHMIRIKAGDGLHYFIEVRQQPDPAATPVQVFDENIPLQIGGRDGGVIVTAAISGDLHNNQQTRLITLLQEHERVMATGDEAIDPLRTLRITVVNDNVQARPRVCRVRVEWAQEIADTPGGDLDLRIEPWGAGYETVDIWVDRNPFGSFDFADPSGNPTGNGDEPRPLELNRFFARVRNDGVIEATDVKVTHYVVTPPGVGDNGNWTPLATYSVGNIPANGSSDDFVGWVPAVGEHTCLKVAISQQLGEVTGGNNQAQENIFNFQPPASSVPEPMMMSLAVRNPLDRKVPIRIAALGAPRGYYVYLPNRWVWLEALGERRMDFFVIPLYDIKELRQKQAEVVVKGWVPRQYVEHLPVTDIPGHRFQTIGGIFTRTTPKQRGDIRLEDKVRQDEGKATVEGRVRPQIKGQKLRVDMRRPDGSVAYEIAETDQRGRFSAAFKLKPPKKRGRETDPRAMTAQARFVELERVSLERIKQAPSKKEKAGATERRDEAGAIYIFQAHIFNARDIAPADSNVVGLNL